MRFAQWFSYWDEHHKEFEWFFHEHGFSREWKLLLNARDMEHRQIMLTLMNRVWMFLPDSKFNIRKNPNGWNSFLYLLENE